MRHKNTRQPLTVLSKIAVSLFSGDIVPLIGICLAFLAVWKAIPAVLDYASRVMDEAAGHFKPAITDIKNTFLDAFSVIKDALVGGDMQGAVKVLLASLKLEFALGLKPLKELWISTKGILHEQFLDLLFGARLAWANFSYGFLNDWTNFADTISEVWDTVWSGVLLAFNRVMWEMKSVWRSIQKFYYNLKSEITGGDYSAEIKLVEQAENRDFTEYVQGKAGIEKNSERLRAEHRAKEDALIREYNAAISGIMKDRENKFAELEDNRLKEFVKMNDEIFELRKGFENAKNYVAAFGAMRKRAQEIEKYFADIVKMVKVDANMQRIVESYKRALESGDEEKRDAAEAALIRAINRERNLARKTSDKFYSRLEEAQSDRVITDEEDKELRALAKERAKHLKLQEQLENIMQTGVASTQAAISEDQKRNGIGGWSSDAVNAMLNNSESKRTADATESSAKTLLDIKRHLQNRKTTITYGS